MAGNQVVKYWFVRSPFKTRKWDDVLMDGVFNLYGIRNYASIKNIAQMEKCDLALWYSGNAAKMVYGTMQIKNEGFIDKTSTANWLAIDFIPKTSLSVPVTLTTIKKNKILENSNILKQKRMSVVEITEREYEEIIKTASAIVVTVEKNG